MISIELAEELGYLDSAYDESLPRYRRFDPAEYDQVGISSWKFVDLAVVVSSSIFDSSKSGARAVIYIDLGVSSALIADAPEISQEPISSATALYVYLVDVNDALFDIAGEAYFREIESTSATGCKFIYRCFRDNEGRKNSWEWNRGIYIEMRGGD